jgi:hypothetical protein
MPDKDQPTITEYRARAEQAAAALLGALLKARAPLESFTAAIRTAVATLNDRIAVPEASEHLKALEPLWLAVGKVDAGAAEASGALLALLTASAEMSDEELTTASLAPSRQMTLPATKAKP